MALSPGVRLTHYEVGSLLGAGGMGEVYQARDTTLARDVALKVIPDGFSRDRERIARFEREAKLLASLNHPNIAAIHSFEREGDIHFLVMELVPGKTLAEILALGPLSLEDALSYFRQVAEALEAAHEKGVIHRDLKPANLKVTPEGMIKVLDFGLAKAFQEEPAAAENLSQSPTREGTRAGIILGTAPYMSPEQARGKRVDKLTDVWSFGCVLYEALTGRAAFHGETVTDTLAAVVRAEPDWSALPKETPGTIRTLLERCLRKDPARRLHDMANVRIELEEAPSLPSSISQAPRARWNVFVPWTVAAVALALSLAILRRNDVDRPMVTRLEFTLPTNFFLTGPVVALSSDGRLLAYIGQQGPSRQVYLRPLDRNESKALSGTDNASSVWFATHDDSLIFTTAGAVKKVSLSDGLVTSLAQASAFLGASARLDGGVVYAANDGLYTVAAAGGKPEKLEIPGSPQEQYRWPVVLPSGKAVLFTRSSLEPGFESRIEALFFDTGATRTVVENATFPRYLATGHLLFGRGETIFVAPFDEKRCETTGAAVPVLDHVWISALGSAHLAVSQGGTLLYASTNEVRGRLVRVDRKGGEDLLISVTRAYGDPRVSPDGRRIVVEAEGKLWLVDPERDTVTRVSFGPGPLQDRAVWTPDGGRILFRGGSVISSKAADGSTVEETVQTEASLLLPTSVSPDGETMAALEVSPLTSGDIVMIPLHPGGEKRTTFLGTTAYEGGAQFSPDGRLVLYASNESGRMEIYVQPYPGPGAKTQISADGGSQPRWRRDGREIFYRNGPKMMAVTVSSGEPLTVGKPSLLFERDYSYSQGVTIPNYDVTPDGHFVMVKTEPPKLNVVLNWFEELKQKVPAR